MACLGRTRFKGGVVIKVLSKGNAIVAALVTLGGALVFWRRKHRGDHPTPA